MLAAQAAGVVGRPLLVGLTGPVSVGKTTIAGMVADELSRVHSLRVSIVSTDGFLFTNAELSARGIAMQKGFPESFDTDRLNGFLVAARAGAGELRVPVYDHLTYDVLAGAEHLVEPSDVLIVEGVNALLPAHIEAYDVTIYVDAPDDAVVRWFITRLVELFTEAVDDPTSFYAPFAHMSDAEVREFAQGAWDSINAVNLERHIRPTRATADVVITKAADHAIVGVIGVTTP